MPMRGAPYPPEFREEAVRLYRSSDRSISQVAQELGISSESLRRWNLQAEIDEEQRDGLTTEEQDELRRLRRKVKTLRLEREFLKKSRGRFNRSVQHARFSVLSGPEVRKWRGWVVLEGCPRWARRRCGSGGGLENP